jgi:hypothetical protein
MGSFSPGYPEQSSHISHASVTISGSEPDQGIGRLRERIVRNQVSLHRISATRSAS